MPASKDQSAVPLDAGHTKLADRESNCIISIRLIHCNVHFSILGRSLCGALELDAMVAILKPCESP